MRFLIVIEKAERGFSAYSPDLPGCVATGATPMDPVSHATPWALASAILADAEGDGWVPPLPLLEVRGGR